MAKGRHNKPRAFALGLLCHMKNYLCIYLKEKRGILRGAPFFVQLSLPSPAHFVIFSPFLAVSQYFVVPLHKNNNKLQENGKDYIDGRPSYR